MKTTTRLLIPILACVTFSYVLFPDRQRAQFLNLYVVNTASDTFVPNACPTLGAGCSLRGAIAAANASAGDDVITFAIPASDGFCSAGVCTIHLSQPLPDITANVSIEGPGAGKLTVRPATGVKGRVFVYNNTGTTFLTGITVSDAMYSGFGGGILKSSGVLNISNCIIRNNHAPNGGGIAQTSGTLNITNTTITGNSASEGSGVHSLGLLNIVNSTVHGNTGAGGGIHVFLGVANISNSTVTANSGLFGGGITKFASSSTTVNLKNTIVAMNTGAAASPDVSGTFTSAGFNLIGKRDGSSGFSAATDQTGTIAAPLDPMLDPSGLRNNGGPIPTIGLLSGSPAIDKGTSNGLTGVLTTDQRGTGFRRTFDNPTIQNAAGGDGTDIGAIERLGKAAFDFDGDGKTDMGIFRPAVAEWWINRSSNGSTFAAQFGGTGDVIVPGDYTGDGRTDIAIWRPSNGSWYILRSEDFSYFAFPFGSNGDRPAPADFDADGKTDAAIFRPSASTWYISRTSDGGTTIQQFGTSGDLPVTADYDGDGRSDIAIYRPSLGQWWMNRSTAGILVATFGNASDKPVQGDFTGDGKVDVAFWRPSSGEWFVLRSEDLSYYSFPFGSLGDMPAPADYDGDGKHDATIFRPSTVTWFSQRSTGGTVIQQFGISGDRPLANAFVP